jgi:hypothetical protein
LEQKWQEKSSELALQFVSGKLQFVSGKLPLVSGKLQFVSAKTVYLYIFEQRWQEKS